MIILLIVIVLIFIFAQSPDSRHGPSTWNDAECRKHLKNHRGGGEADSYYGARGIIHDEDNNGDDSFLGGAFSNKADSSGGDFYGGLPFGDGKIFMTDDDDFIDEFGDDML